MGKFVKGKARIYQNIKRKLKDGTNKTYTTEQHTLTMDKTDLFADGEEVIIIPVEEYNMLHNDFKLSKNSLDDFNHVQELYLNSQKTNEDLLKEISRLRNKHDHLQDD